MSENETPVVDLPAADDLAAISSKGDAKIRASVELIRILSEHPEHAQYLKELVAAEAQRETFDQDIRLARVFALSGKFDDIKGATEMQSIASAMAKIMIGRQWGMNDADSIAFIIFINGRPSVMTEIMAARMQQAGYSWDTEFHYSEEPGKPKFRKKCVGCTLWLKQYSRDTNRHEPVMGRNNEQVSSSFTEDDAEAAGLLGKAGPWKQWTQDMYFWRAMSRLRKYHLTSIMRGAIQAELASDYAPPTMAPQLAAPAEAPAEEERKPLRERILAQEEQGSLLDEETE